MRKVLYLVIGLLIAAMLRFIGLPSFANVLYFILGEPNWWKNILVLAIMGLILFFYFKPKKEVEK